MPLIVTGCPRSGTTTMAEVLGIAHERQFSVKDVARNAQNAMAMIQSESAWPVAPFVGRLLLRADCRVLHLVRNPRHCIASMMQRQLLGRRAHVNDAFIRKHVTLPPEATLLEACTVMWVKWNGLVDKHEMPRIRIEDVAGAPRCNPSHSPSRLSWGDIPAAHSLAKEYGYGP